MPTHFTNVQHNLRADLSQGHHSAPVIGYAANAGNNQKWTSTPGVDGGTVTSRAGDVAVGAENANDGAIVRGNDPLTKFSFEPVNGGVRIRLVGSRLYWTLDEEPGQPSPRVKLRPLREGANANTQIWALSDAP